MAKVPVRDASGEKVGDADLPAELFEAPVNVPLMHQVVVAGLASLRAGTHSTKTRAEVAGGGRKPWRQKGTGRARHGSTRSPIWTGGGVAHGPKPRDHSMRVNKKMKRGALRSSLSDAAASGKIAMISDLSFDEPSTAQAAAVLEALELDGRVLVVLPEPQDVVERSFRNLRSVRLTYSRSLSAYDVMAADHVLLTEASLEVLQGREPEQHREPPPGDAEPAKGRTGKAGPTEKTKAPKAEKPPGGTEEAGA